MDFPLTDLSPPSPRPTSPVDSRAATPTPTPTPMPMPPDPFANPPPPDLHVLTPTPTAPTDRIRTPRRESDTSTPTPISPFDDAHGVIPATGKTITPRPRDKPSQPRSSRLQPPPPLPLGLPPPRTPPPAIPLTPEEAAAAASAARGKRYDEDVRPSRWWHEWLCGCGEGPDRGGDHQVSASCISKTYPLTRSLNPGRTDKPVRVDSWYRSLSRRTSLDYPASREQHTGTGPLALFLLFEPHRCRSSLGLFDIVLCLHCNQHVAHERTRTNGLVSMFTIHII